MFTPGLQLRPLGALLVYAAIGLLILGLFGSITLGGAVVFVLIGLVALLAVYFLIRRFTGRLAGRR
jgi:asparagine N-glycosylation enzyme membrane subunit Stt3